MRAGKAVGLLETSGGRGLGLVLKWRQRQMADDDVRLRFLDIDGFRAIEVDIPAVPRVAHDALTSAECDVAALMLSGLSAREIGQLRVRSARTIANQVASIYRKLGVSNRSELAKKLRS